LLFKNYSLIYFFFNRRSQTNSAGVSETTDSQWDFDFLDTKLNNSNNNDTSTPVNHSETTSTPIDPFDMDSLVQQSATTSRISPEPVQQLEDDENPLGILAKPASKEPAKHLSNRSSSPEKRSPTPAKNNGNRIILSEDDEDAMIAQLIDMGFSLQESTFAIEATGGSDLQAAVDLLVQNSETVQRYQPSQTIPSSSNANISPNERARQALFSDGSEQQRPRQRQETPRNNDKHTQDTMHIQTEKIVSQAQEIGGFLYKNATSYFKAGREKVTKAVGDWQEQQRVQRLQHMQQEQNGPVRPKWMTDNEEPIDMSNNRSIEKFADDDDDDEQANLETERRKIQEMRRIQEQKSATAAAQKVRQQQQQQNRRNQALIQEDQDVYVSPSRRRAGTPSSGRSTPRSAAASPQLQQQPLKQQAPVKPKANFRTRPVVEVNAQVMSKANAARAQGNEKFKLGQFGEAEEHYTTAIELLPAGHDHQVLLCNNRAMARLKIGNYKKCVEDCNTAIGLAKQSGDGSSTSEGVTIQWRDQITKSLYRKAEALENIEKYKDALATYDELFKYEGSGNAKVNQGMSRCRRALNPKQQAQSPPPSVSSQTPSRSSPSKKEDFMSMFDPAASTTTSTSMVSPAVNHEELGKSKAVAAMRAKAAEQEAEDAERLEKTDDVNARLVVWKAGKEQNLRALLATLDTLLWPGAQWKGAQMSELINPKKCKITYMKAIGKVHPDKVIITQNNAFRVV
jgi:tetratricopeptide (TPR) repeat protein